MRSSNCIFILDLTSGLNGLSKVNCKTGRKSFKFWDLVRVALESLQYIWPMFAVELSRVIHS